MITYLQLRQKLRGVLWPDGEAVSLRTAHDGFFKEAMMELQKWVECLRQHNVSTFDFSTTFWHDGKTVVNAPFGDIRKVYTVANDDFRDAVIYRSATIEEMECWARNLWSATAPTTAEGEELELGYHPADLTSDSAVGRARVGIWTVYRNRLYVGPWIQSSEKIVVDWDGEKTDWADTDSINQTYWTFDVEAAISYYVGYKHEIFYGDKAEAGKYDALFKEKLSDLIWKCREYTRKKLDHACDAGSAESSNFLGITQEELDDDAPIDTTDEDHVLFDVVGDVEETAEGILLSQAVQADNPEFLVLAGDIGYADGHGNDFGGSIDDIYGWAKTAGIIIPVPGNHDYISGTLDLYQAYFEDELEGKNNGRFYDFSHGSVHGFVENRNTQEADGYTNASIQAQWLIAKATLSPARWKFAFGHQPPFSSDTTYGSNTDLQRAYAAAGIQVCFSAHAHVYEHLLIAGVHYVNCGLGGRSRYAFGAAVSGSITRYNAMETRVRVTLDCDTCLIEAVNSAGVVIDSFTIEHA